MKKYIWQLLLCLPFYVFGQKGELIDARDNQSYETIEFNGQRWMRDNLNWKTELSLGFSKEMQMLYPDISGRWYHMNELHDVCPEGWRLPTADDWIYYFDSLVSDKGVRPKIKSRNEGVSITNISKHINLFEPDNLLNIYPVGIFQGSDFVYAAEMADFWIQDLATKETLQADQKYKPVKYSYENASHIHLYNDFTQIHSHEHHLDPSDEPNLRRFLVRCVFDLDPLGK